MTHQKRLGDWGETEARRYLEAKAYVFIERNFRVPAGEKDLVMQDGDIVVFIEVKTRTSGIFGTPEESVSRAKRKRLIRAAWAFLQERERIDDTWRVDVVAIEASPNWTIQRLDHYQSAFDIDFNSL